MTPRERLAPSIAALNVLLSEPLNPAFHVIVRDLEAAITAATDGAYERAAKAAMDVMERLNTSYRHEIADAIHALRSKP